MTGTSPRASLPIVFEDVGLQIGQTKILQNISMTIEPGAPLLLVGPNGSGKSSLLRVAMGLVPPTSGRVVRPAGTDPDRRAFLFQRPVMLRRSVAVNVAYGLASAPGDRRTKGERVEALLERVGLASLAGRAARSLSGGEQQRVALARALAREPDILFLDEPTANLDPAATRLVEEIVLGAAASGIKIVMASHDLGQVRRLAGEIVFLLAGRLRDRRPTAEFFASPQPIPETAAFLRGDIVLDHRRSLS